MAVGDRLRVTTGSMAYGPHAVARHDGKVLFVRGGAPDEALDVVVREERERYAFADVAGVAHASAVRREPPCPYLPRCGGCPWQHLTPEAQRAAKQQVVAEHLRRIAGLDVAVAAPLALPAEFGYRRRITLRVDDAVAGFAAAASHDIVPIAHCLLAEPAIDALIVPATALAGRLAARVRRISLIGGAAGERVVVAGEVEGAWPPEDAPRCLAWLAEQPTVAGLVLQGRRWRQAWGDTAVRVTVADDHDLTVHAPGFTQVTRAGNRLLVDTVTRLVGAAPGQRVLDLYAGAGNLSARLYAAGAVVTAVEEHAGAAADARRNLAAGSAPARVITARAERALRELVAAGERYDCVVLDPPRSGAAACVPELLRLAAPRLVYVSCDPATLARDLRALRAAYRIDVVQPLDLFPQTYHVETVVAATLTCEPHTPGVGFDPRSRARVRGRGDRSRRAR